MRGFLGDVGLTVSSSDIGECSGIFMSKGQTTDSMLHPSVRDRCQAVFGIAVEKFFGAALLISWNDLIRFQPMLKKLLGPSYPSPLALA